jgi:hypothetical protein
LEGELTVAIVIHLVTDSTEIITQPFFSMVLCFVD